MADADQALTIRITADAQSGTQGVSAVADALAQLQAAYEASGATGEKFGSTITAAHEAGAEGAKKHTEAETILGASIGKVEIATNAGARAFEALGIKTGEVTSRILALGEAFDALKGAAPELLALAAVVGTVAASFAFLKDAISVAADEQATMVQLGQAITNNGGSWNIGREAVEKWLDTVSLATTYSRGELLGGLRDLTTAGVDQADSMKLGALATDIAAGSGRSYSDVVHVLVEAEEGRGRGLLSLDKNLKKVIESHGDLQTAITDIARLYAGDAAAATKTFEGRQHELANAFDEIKLVVGEAFLPAMTDAAEYMIGFALKVEDGAKAFGGFAKAILDDTQHAVDALQRLYIAGEKTIALFNPANLLNNVGKAVGDLSSGKGKNFGADLLGLDGSEIVPTNLWSSQFEKAKELGLTKISDAEAQFKKMLGDMKLDSGGTVFGEDPKTKAQKAPFEEEPLTFDGAKTDAIAAAQKSLDQQLKELAQSTTRYKDATALATTESGHFRAEMTEQAAAQRNAQAAIALLTHAIGSQATELSTLQIEEKKQTAAAVEATADYKKYDEILKSIGGGTATQKQHLKDLKEAQEVASKAVNVTSDKIKELTGDLDTNKNALAGAVHGANELKDAHSALSRTIEDTIAQMRIENALKEINDKGAYDNAIKDQQRAYVDEVATYGKSLAQQKLYYELRFAEITGDSDKERELKKQYSADIFKIDEDENKASLDAQKAFLTQATDLETTFVDDIIGQHKSLRDSLKDVWKDILADYVKMIEEMILKSSLFSGLNKEISGIFGGFGGSGPTGGSAASSIFAGASSASMSGIDTPGSNPVFEASAQTIAAIGKSVASAGSTFSVNGTTYNTADLYHPSTPGLSAGSAIGGAVSGAGIGGVVAGIDGGNAEGSSIGGALGGVLGAALHANPLIGAGIDVVSSIIGSLFGDHTTPAGSPDIYNTQAYGQGVADLTGKKAGANGSTFYTSSSVLSQTGGSGEISFIEEQLAAAQKQSNGYYTLPNGTQINPQQYAQYLADFGESATGGGKLNFGHNIGDQWITGATGATSSTKKYSDLDALASQFLGLDSGGSSTTSPVFSVSRSLPNMQPGTLNPNGTYNETTGATTIATSPISTASGVAAVVSGVVAQLGNGSDHGINVHVNITGNPTIAGAGGLQEFADTIGSNVATTLQRLNLGQITGGVRGRRLRFGNA